MILFQTQNNGMDVPFVILGDPAYPWLMKPYTATGTITREQKQFNYQLSRAQVVVECAFGHLKGPWRSLMKGMTEMLASCQHCQLEWLSSQLVLHSCYLVWASCSLQQWGSCSLMGLDLDNATIVVFSTLFPLLCLQPAAGRVAGS